MKTLKGFEDIEISVVDDMVTLTQRRSYTTHSIIFPMDQVEFLTDLIAHVGLFADEAHDES